MLQSFKEDVAHAVGVLQLYMLCTHDSSALIITGSVIFTIQADLIAESEAEMMLLSHKLICLLITLLT